MSVSKVKGPVFDSGLCRCCGTMKRCRVLNIEYESLGQKEVYTDMIMDCYGLLMSHLDGALSERLICATCVTRIRDALNFRRQVLRCEEAFLQMKDDDITVAKNIAETQIQNSVDDLTKTQFIDVGIVKSEPGITDDQSDHEDALADACDDEHKPDLSQDSNDSTEDLPLKSIAAVEPKTTKSGSVWQKPGAASLARQMLITRKRLAEKLKQKSECQNVMQRCLFGKHPRDSPLKNEQHMSKMQHQMREKDSSYKREKNILTIVEFSYVCPFKCRHNHLLCYYCGELFPDPVLLREHTLNRHNPRNFKITEHRNIIKIDITRIDCRLCGVKIDSLDDFRSHITSVHNKKYYYDIKESVLPFKLTKDNLKCAMCDNVFPYFHALNKHMNEHFRNYMCETCGLEVQLHFQHIAKSSEVEIECKNRANTIILVENSFVCPFYNSYSDYYCIYCKDKFTDPDKLREHTATHDPMTFKDNIAERKILLVDIVKIDCRLCLTKIDDIDSLKTHLTNCHGKKFYETSNDFLKFRLTANNLTCTECGSTFSFFHALKKHMAKHFGTCICDICGAHYFEKRMLILHLKSHQNVEECFSCKDCGKAFKSKHSRYVHETQLHKKEPAYPCHKCDAVLFSYSLRYRHMIDVHGEKRMFPCEHCDRTYDSRRSLRDHNRRNHLKILKHQCDLCDKRYYIPSRLKDHMATHTGERNYRCEFCGKSYPRLQGLKVHMQSHSNKKKYCCALCNASFTQNVNLKFHMKRQHQS